MNDQLIKSMELFIEALLLDDVEFITEEKFADSKKYKKKLSKKQKKYQALVKSTIEKKFGKGKKMSDLSKAELTAVYKSLEYSWQTDDEKKGDYGKDKKDQTPVKESMISEVTSEESYANDLMIESCSLLGNRDYRSAFTKKLIALEVTDPSELLMHEKIKFYLDLK